MFQSEDSNHPISDTVVEQTEPSEDWDDVTSVFVPEPEPSMVDDAASIIAPYNDEDVLSSEPPAVLLGGIPLIPIVEEVSEDPEVTGAILDTESPSVERVNNPYNYGDDSVDDGFVASLDIQNALVIDSDALDVEEPLALVEFPSIEEVRSQDASFSGDIDALFDQSEPSVFPASQNLATPPSESGNVEPKWTGSTAFDNLVDSEDALGDEKYSMEQAQLGDVDAVLSESIRDFSEVEQKGSVWGMFFGCHNHCCFWCIVFVES